MFSFKKSRAKQADAAEPSEQESKSGKSWFGRLKKGLSRTSEGLADVFLVSKQIDDDTLEEIETALLVADVGIESTNQIISDLSRRLSRNELKDKQALVSALHDDMCDILKVCDEPLTIPDEPRPFVILTVGVNGVGKTTTIGKLAQHLKRAGMSVMLAAGDTFRAAAVEQLQTWGERNDVPVIAQHEGADSASVIYDAVESAKAKNIDVLIADTAGRLHTQTNLMEELKKVKRVMGKVDASAPHEVLMIVDATTGQNALNQAQQFHDAVGITGLCITKLDGTAKGGVIFPMANKLKLPIRFIGVGESIDDLRAFDAEDFVNALLDLPEDGSEA